MNRTIINLWYRVESVLFTEHTVVPISVFRILWGILMSFNFFEALTARGEYRYFNTVFHFRYPGFEFIPVLNDQWLLVVFAVGLITSIFLLFGYFYKAASVALFIVYLYVFSIDQAYFNNHYYFYCLVNLFFLFVPANQHFSLDHFWRKTKPIKTYRWMLLLFQLQICIVYFYGGVSKLLNPEWLSGLAVKTLYTNISNRLEWGLGQDELTIVALIVTFGGLIFDLLVPFGLMAKTRWIKLLSFCFIFFFNISNAITLQIGTFPFAMMASVVLFVFPAPQGHFRITQAVEKNKSLVIGLIAIHFAFQLIFPLRHLVVNGNVFWTGESKMWSWHMMSGGSDISAAFFLAERDEKDQVLQWHELDPSKFLNKTQLRNLGKYPALIPQFAKFLKREAELAGMTNVAVYADILVSRNDKPYRFIVHPEQELSGLKYNVSLKHNNWILLYKEENQRLYHR
ncbi:MAG: HTTM domain-containing protein [Flavobacteriales bacterium]|nr:HTTM domain-containing protein [Flavobacteriales bacterium]